MSRRKYKLASSPLQPSAQEREALDWLARLDRGLTPEQEAEFERWLAANPAHSDAFGEFDGTWSLLNRLREAPEATTINAPADPDVFAPRRRSRRATTTWSWVVLAAAAAIALGMGAWHFGPRSGQQSSDFALNSSSEAGSIRKLDLPDGSIIQLNRGSAVDVRFTAHERRVRLSRGEAHFTVAKNPARPFVVSASAVDVRAIGTAFNVRLQSQAVEVLVTEGKVRVDDDQGRSLLPAEAPLPATAAVSRPESPVAGGRALIAGEKVTIALVPQAIAVPAPAVPVALASSEMERALAWREHSLEFVSAPLADLVAEFNRHNRQQLVIEDRRLAAQHFGGTFRADDVAGFVRMLETHFGIVAERGAEKIILRSAP